MYKGNWTANERMIYWIAAALGQPKPSLNKVRSMADKFCFFELDRIYKHVKRRPKLRLIA
jgi:hypothetical protein